MAPTRAPKVTVVLVVKGSRGVKSDLLADGPDESCELARDRDEDDLVWLAKGEESPIASMETMLSGPGDATNLLR